MLVTLVVATGLHCTAHADTWSLFALVVADGNLKAAGEDYCRRLMRAAEDAKWSVALQLDNGTDQPSRLLLRHGLAAPVAGQPQSTDYGDPHSLAEFFRWAAENAPAEHYAVAIFGHGVSASGPDADGVPAEPWPVLATRSSAGGHSLRPDVLSRALEDGLEMPADVLVLDCCYGASLEVAWDLRDTARVIVASPGRAPSSGVPWGAMLEDGTTLAPYEVGHKWADAAVGTVALQTTGLRRVSSCVSGLSAAFVSSTEETAPVLTEARSECQAWGPENEMCDLQTLCTRLAQRATGEVATAAARTAEALAACQISSKRGVTVPFPSGFRSCSLIQRSGGFGQVSGWDDMVSAYRARQQDLMRRTLDDRRNSEAAT